MPTTPNVNTVISLEQLLEAVANRERIKQEQLYLAFIEISKFEELKMAHDALMKESLDLASSNGMEKSLRKLAEVKAEKLEKDNAALRKATLDLEECLADTRGHCEGKTHRLSQELVKAQKHNQIFAKAIRAIINSKGRSDRKLKKILALLP